MHRTRYWLFILLLIGLVFGRPGSIWAQSGITYPPETDILRGPVEIRGSAVHPDFWKYELSAAPQGTENWFNIVIRETPVENGVLGVWDTRTVADGPYSIRLRVVHRDGNYDEYFVRNVIVRNAGPEPTATPQTTPTPTATPTPKPPTATPVQITPQIPTPAPSPTSSPVPAAAGSSDQGSGEGGHTSSAFLELLHQASQGFMRGFLYVTLAFAAVGVFFGIKYVLTWIYVRFFLR